MTLAVSWGRSGCHVNRCAFECFDRVFVDASEICGVASKLMTADANDGKTADASSSGEDFEGALARLEAVVGRLEEGDLTLEEALTAFEEGVRLTRQCAEQLQAAERRIEVLTQQGGDWMAQAFDETEPSSSPPDAEA